MGGIQTAAEFGKIEIAQAISNVPRTSIDAWKIAMQTEKANIQKTFSHGCKFGGYLGYLSLPVDLKSSWDADITAQVPIEKSKSNVVVNGTFDIGGIALSGGAASIVASTISGAEAGSVVPGYGTAIGAGVRLITSAAYIGVTQVWKPDGESIQDHVKDIVANYFRNLYFFVHVKLRLEIIVI